MTRLPASGRSRLASDYLIPWNMTPKAAVLGSNSDLSGGVSLCEVIDLRGHARPRLFPNIPKIDGWRLSSSSDGLIDPFSL